MSIKGKIVIPGGCGFIGTNFVRRIVERVGELEIVVFDKLTYSGDFGNIKELVEKKKVRFVRGDIAELESVKKYFAGADYIVNFAAETHVDRSLKEPYPFVMTNFVGVANILEFVRENPVTRFLHISTDEVYGPTNENNIAKEDSPLRPTTPYASTKASADMLCISYARAFELDIIIARPTNNYGPYQYPEKLIPLFIMNSLLNRALPLYGDGLYIRDWVFVDDTVEALLLLLERGTPGEIYNISAQTRKRNIEVARKVLEVVGKGDELITFVEDRKVHDRGYFIDNRKIRALGWEPKVSFDEGLKRTVEFYASREDWWQKVR